MPIIVAGEIKINPAAKEGALRLYEEWADEAALDAHMASPHMAEFNAKIVEIEVLGVEVKFFTAEPLDRG